MDQLASASCPVPVALRLQPGAAEQRNAGRDKQAEAKL